MSNPWPTVDRFYRNVTTFGWGGQQDNAVDLVVELLLAGKSARYVREWLGFT